MTNLLYGTRNIGNIRDKIEYCGIGEGCISSLLKSNSNNLVFLATLDAITSAPSVPSALVPLSTMRQGRYVSTDILAQKVCYQVLGLAELLWMIIVVVRFIKQ